MRYVIFSQEHYAMQMLRKIMTENFPSAVFVGWTDNCLSARQLLGTANPSFVLMEAELADGSVQDAVGGWNGYGVLIYESLADSIPAYVPPRFGKLVKPVSAEDLKKIMFNLKLYGL